MNAARRQPRRAVVLAGGGVVGFAWLLGALSALESVTETDTRDTDLVLATSAGAVVGALLGCGVSVDELCRDHQGYRARGASLPAYDYDTATGGALPPRPALRLGSPRLVMHGLRHPRRSPPLVTLAGLVPPGRGSLRAVHDMLGAVASGAGPAGRWPADPALWLVAVDYRTGRRALFGADGAAPLTGAGDGVDVVRGVPLADAVVASCSLPGWYPPATIGSARYVDGGTASVASLDLLAGHRCDEVYVLAPMAALHHGRRRVAGAGVANLFRAMVTRRILADAARLRAAGTTVHVLAPGGDELTAMGANMMNPRRRREVLDNARVAVTATLRARRAASGERAHKRLGA